jgi:PAS domain S-box-containing protein
LVKEGKLMAIFTLLDKSHRDWSAGEIDLAEQIADRTWLAVENARSETALRASEERFRNLANSAPVFVWLSGVDKRCYWFNKPWLDFTGRTLEEEIGHGWLAAVHPDDRVMCEKAYQSDIEDRLRFTIEYRLRGRKGEYHWLLDNGIPLYSVSGVFTGYIGSRIDITERKRSEEERESLLASERSARAEAEQASRMKDEFLSTLSHELRTPLNAILGWTTVLRTGRVSPEDRDKGLEVIDRNVRIQARLIEDLLDMSRIISGKLRLDVQQINLSNVVTAAIESIQPASEAKQIRLIKILDTKNDIVYGDASRLQQVIWNLLSNAIKFTPKEGKVTVILERVDSHLEVSVSDSGEGITPEFLPVIFERFRQSDGSTTRRHGGLGLGLSIVKQLVELHGGTVRASSRGLGRGATFTVTLPLAVLSSAEGPQPHHDDKPDGFLDSPRLDGIKVLVVDDEPDARELVRRLISDQSASVETASTADEALAILRQFHPDVLVSDIGMPDKDGYQLIREIRKLAPNEGGATPAAALTAFARSEDRRRALMAGYQTQVTKPVDPAELITIIASLAGRTGSSAGCNPPHGERPA